MQLAAAFDPVGAAFEPLHAFLRQARDQAPVFHWAAHDVWIVTRYDDVQQVLGDAEHFTVEGNLGVMNNRYCPSAQAILATGIDWLQVPQVNGVEGEAHSRLRKVMQSILTPQRFREMEPRIRAEVATLIDRFQSRGACEFVSEFAYPLPVAVIFAIIGFRIDEEDLAQLQQWSDDTFRLWLAPMTDAEQIACARNAVAFQAYIKRKIADRRRQPRDDLLTDFVGAVDAGDGRLSEDELTLLFPMNLIGAGHETTKSALGNAVYHLLAEPARWQAIVDDPAGIPAAIEETLRWDGSVFGWYRVVKAPVELAGVQLPAGAKVMALMGSANHDERRFEAADRFCPARAAKPGHLTFSYGRHFCLGAPLARLEMRIALEQLTARLPGLRLAPGQDFGLDPSAATRGFSQLHLCWDMPA